MGKKSFREQQKEREGMARTLRRTQSMPLPMLKGIRKSRAKAADRKKELERLSGMFEKKAKQRKTSVSREDMISRMLGDRRGLKGVGDGSRGLRGHSVGRFSGGQLRLTASEIRDVEEGKRGGKGDGPRRMQGEGGASAHHGGRGKKKGGKGGKGRKKSKKMSWG